ncbi:MAG TPA: aminoacyl-tRNA hydrolase [Methylomirabilota bacterium]|nr:aminoacyl-tRNA hydrolase [Methylomirabilota bacterium]
MPSVPQLVVGLGNPGPAYQDTRHNVGQAVLDRLAQRLGGRFRLRGPAVLAETTWNGAPLHLAKPVTFMNVVGPGVARLLRDLGLDPTTLIVVHDDIDLPFGRVRIRHKGRHGGHNGVRSLIDALGTEGFRRVKVGVGRPDTKDEVVDWVLAGFDSAEREALPVILEQAADAVLRLAASPPARDA